MLNFLPVEDVSSRALVTGRSLLMSACLEQPPTPTPLYSTQQFLPTVQNFSYNHHLFFGRFLATLIPSKTFSSHKLQAFVLVICL